MNRLLKIGFSYVGNWTLNGTDRLILNLSSNHNSKNILYSFICNGEIKYIGKSIQKLEDRLYGYQNPGSSQSTNIRVNKLLIEHPKGGNPVDIFILNDNGLLNFGGFKINIAAGLEDSLIYEIGPEWNFSGKKIVVEDKHSNETLRRLTKTENNKGNLNVNNTFDVKIGQTYLNQGFFNVPISHSQLFADDGTEIEIILGYEKRVIIGYINRRANLNSTPRIMGGSDLRDWIKGCFKLNDNMNVTIISPVSIELTK